MSKARLYFPKLDSVRCYAAFAVVFAHIFQIWTWREDTVTLFPLGRIGVIVFFVLSGFLITLLLLNEPADAPLRRSFKNFYMRRTLRIFPIYYLYLLVAFSINLDAIHDTGALPWLYLTNIFIFTRDSWLLSNSHLWSLSVEEQFYLVWPFIVLLLRQKPKALLGVFSAICAGSVLLRFYLQRAGFSGDPQIMVFTFSTLDFLALGGVLALAHRHYGARIGRFGLPLLVGGVALYYGIVWLASFPALESAYWSIGHFSLGLIGAGLLLYSVHSTARLTPLHNPLTAHLGKISYGIYLYHNPLVAYHQPIFGFVGINIGDSLTARVFSSLLLVVLAAELSYRFIEKPLLRLKERFR